MKFVIMAGGFGSKLWPLSREKAPKQFISVIGEKSLFQLTIDSILTKYSIDDIFVSTTEDVEHYVLEQAPNLRKENITVEPMMRDTGPASCLAMAKVAERYPDEVVYFYVQCVCVRSPAEKYMEMVAEMENLVKKYDKLVTGTLIPKYLETGSDLFKMGNLIESESGLKVHNVEEFINVVNERMTIEQVTEIAKNNVVGTHANHYTWTPKSFFEAVSRIRPDWMEVVEELRGIFGKEDERERMREVYSKFNPARIEVFTTELIKEGKVMAIELPFEWAHVTTWDDVYRYRENHGISLMEGDVFQVEGEGNLVISTDKKKFVSLIDMKDVVVVDTGDCLLISPRESSSKVKVVLDQLKQEGREELL